MGVPYLAKHFSANLEAEMRPCDVFVQTKLAQAATTGGEEAAEQEILV